MYFITISEMLGTNGEMIAQKVSKELNYHFYGEEELFKAADELGYLQDIKRLGEKSPALLDRFFSEKPKIYLDRLQSVIYEVAKKGDAVFFGRGSQLLLHSFECAFHVLVIGSMPKRVMRVMDLKKVSKEVAEKIIHRSDHDKKGFIRFAFDEDWLNPFLYDLIINTDKLSIDSAVRIIVNGALTDEIKSCGLDSMINLKKLSIQRQIESLLLESGLMSSHLFFTVENGGLVKLLGVVNSQEEKEKVEALVRKVKDIEKVENNLLVIKHATSGV